MSFGKNRNLSNDLIYYYSSQPLPKMCFISPNFFTQKSVHTRRLLHQLVQQQQQQDLHQLEDWQQ